MPKATVDEDCCAIFGEHDIWLAGKILPVQAISIAAYKKSLP
jgi:hypothetical protein